VLESPGMPPGDPLRPGSPRPRPTGEPPPSSAETDPAHDLAAALHEVSNALTVVLGWADAASRATDGHAVKTALDIVRSRASQARDIARRAIGASVAPRGPSPAAAVAQDAALGLEVEATRAQVTIDVDVDPGARALEVTSGLSLLQVLTNLLLNAIAFSPAGSTVRLAVSAVPAAPVGGPVADGASRAPRALFRVDDAGPGIAPELRARLFEGGVTSRRGGAGIGLRHSAVLAASAGGELRLGEAVTGTQFQLFWPAVAQGSARRPPRSAGASPFEDGAAQSGPPPRSEERPVEPRPSIDGARILIVEDDDAVIELLELALEARGASVVSVKARADLPRVLASGCFDAALLDMSPLLGDVDGAVAELHRANPHTRLVVMSGSVPPAVVSGAATWVRKPFEVREIVDALAVVGAAGAAVAKK
jgi:CheY-like chemotaxis protein